MSDGFYDADAVLARLRAAKPGDAVNGLLVMPQAGPLAPVDLRAKRGAEAFVAEFLKARAAHGPMTSAHEGYAVILEELDEIGELCNDTVLREALDKIWVIVKQKQKNRNYDDLRKEVVQLGAMALAFLIEIVDTENRK